MASLPSEKRTDAQKCADTQTHTTSLDAKTNRNSQANIVKQPELSAMEALAPANTPHCTTLFPLTLLFHHLFASTVATATDME